MRGCESELIEIGREHRTLSIEMYLRPSTHTTNAMIATQPRMIVVIRSIQCIFGRSALSALRVASSAPLAADTIALDVADTAASRLAVSAPLVCEVWVGGGGRERGAVEDWADEIGAGEGCDDGGGDDGGF